MNKNISRVVLCGAVCLSAFVIACKLVKNFEESKNRFNNYVTGLSNTDVFKLKYYEKFIKN